MALKSDDKALAAYLVDRGLATLDEVVSALERATKTNQDLADALMAAGVLDAKSLETIREEAIRHDTADVLSIPTPIQQLEEIKGPDTLFDVPVPSAGATTDLSTQTDSGPDATQRISTSLSFAELTGEPTLIPMQAEEAAEHAVDFEGMRTPVPKTEDKELERGDEEWAYSATLPHPIASLRPSIVGLVPEDLQDHSAADELTRGHRPGAKRSGSANLFSPNRSAPRREAVERSLLGRDIPGHEAADVDREVVDRERVDRERVDRERVDRERLDREPFDREAFDEEALERSPSGGVELQVERFQERLAPSGKRVEERYLLLGEIGRGGMGRVLKAIDTEIGREVAIKALLIGPNAPDKIVHRFWTEVQATGQLEHPSIIPVHDVGRFPTGELFYVMKKLSGRTLATILGLLRAKDLGVSREFTRVRLLTIFQQIAYAVAFAHARGVIHRDIKPGNIMVGSFGEAMLLDWGLAKVLIDNAKHDHAKQESASEFGARSVETPERTPDRAPDRTPDRNSRLDPLSSPSQERTFAGRSENEEPARVRLSGQVAAKDSVSGTITGTPQYMAPEATEGRPDLITTKSDVYGLGAVLYEILTLIPAFADLGFVTTVVKVREGQFRPPRESAPNLAIPEELEDLCLAAMDRDPSKRPSAKDLADEIGGILEGAKERERRTRRAKELVREGKRANERWRALKLELHNAESEVKRLVQEVPPWASPELKESLWAIEDRVAELKIEAVGAFEEAERTFLRALGEASDDDRDSKSALAGLYFARFGECERARDAEGQRYYRGLVSRYDDGVWTSLLDSPGVLDVAVDRSDAEIAIAPMEVKGRLLRPGASQLLTSNGRASCELPAGSYLLSVRVPEEREIPQSVLIVRSESKAVEIRYRTSGEIGDGFVLVPAGTAIIGGDPAAQGSLARDSIHIAEFAISRFPVTCGEYLEFLNDLARDHLATAIKLVPRARDEEVYSWHFDEESQRFTCSFRPSENSHRFADFPVAGINLRDALTYIEWRSAKSGERLRLPHEHEWEKAARGADGRFYPWGDHFDPTFCKMRDSRNWPHPGPEPVGAFPNDTSLYGARDMAGGIRELCFFMQADEMVPVMRGGSWQDTGQICRVASRQIIKPDHVSSTLGFRLVKEL